MSTDLRVARFVLTIAGDRLVQIIGGGGGGGIAPAVPAAITATTVWGNLVVSSSLLANGRAIVKAPNVLKMVPVVDKALDEILVSADVNALSWKSVRRQLEAKFKVSLKPDKKEIKKMLMAKL